MIERLAEANPLSAERLLAIGATAAGRRAAIAEWKRSYAAGRAGGQPLIRPQEPGAAITAELEAFLRETAAIQERERIAGELRARVIQRVFASGLALESAAGLTTQPEVRSRIEAAVDGLDEVIRIIRDAIFGAADRPPNRERGRSPQTASGDKAD
jgi:signal transduction histidine kinase